MCGRFRLVDPEEFSRIHAFSRQDYYLIICGKGFDSWIRRNSPASTRFLGRVIIVFYVVRVSTRGSGGTLLHPRVFWAGLLSYYMWGGFRLVDPEELSRIHAFSGQDIILLYVWKVSTRGSGGTLLHPRIFSAG